LRSAAIGLQYVRDGEPPDGGVGCPRNGWSLLTELKMSLPRFEPRHTDEEYLAMERGSEERHEYLDGQIYAMAGETLEHGIICTNLSWIIRGQLLSKPCLVLSKDMKVRSGPLLRSSQVTKGLYSYPDLLVVCDQPEFHDDYKDVLLNPVVIIEVLSATTEAYDRGQKFLRYRTWLKSLTDYIVVSQYEPLVEHFTLQPDGVWAISATVVELDGSVSVNSIGCVLSLKEVYDRVVFPSPPQESVSP
jgi:Uma2 family endonuclease